MATTKDRERKMNYILTHIANHKEALIDKERFIANASLDLLTTERTIREMIQTLEKAKRVDKRVWK